MNKKVILMILDGWGKSTDPKVSAIDQAHTPFIDYLYKKYPNASLRTDGLHVGLPEGQMGNSEVGHLNLGAGRIVYQDLVKINQAIDNNTLAIQPALKKAFLYATTNNKPVHFLGLMSDGGVHSHINHLFNLIEAAHEFGIKNSYVHALTDGRDVDPKSGVNHLKALQNRIKPTNTKLASIIGRYYAMDRDNRWERIKWAYDALVYGIGEPSTNSIASVLNNYENNTTDEFLKPIVMVDQFKKPIATIADGDVVIFFNFRTDRGRQLTQALTQQSYSNQNMHPLNLYYVTMTNYDDAFKDIHVIYNKENLSDTLGEVLEKNQKTQLRIAETEKYPHVTFFFSGGRETPFIGEQRILKESPKVATYDLKPEMSAYLLKDALIPELIKKTNDFVCLNFANGDMVGHTGNLEAAIKACETVDSCVKDIITTAIDANYTTLVIADHGNCETMLNPDGTINTAHTTNPVPIIIVDNNISSINSGILGNVAPTILKLMGVKKPKVMTLNALI